MTLTWVETEPRSPTAFYRRERGVSNVIYRVGKLPHFQVPKSIVEAGILGILPPTALKLYLVLAYEAQQQSSVTIEMSDADFHRRIGLSPNSCTRARKSLEKFNLVRVGRGRSFSYTLCDPITDTRLDEMPDSEQTPRRVSKLARKDIRDITPAQRRAYYTHYFPDAKFTADKEQYTVACPLHDDQHPSLSINLATGQWYCHGCNRHGAVVAFEMALTGCTKLEAVAQIAKIINEPALLSRSRGIVEARYDYMDEFGAVLWQLVRYTPKGFTQRHFTAEGKWKPGRGEAKAVLYRLPEVIAASEVIVCEGEKDCENVRALGLKADDGTLVAVTTSPDGAGKWRPAFNEVLRGKFVIIFPDGDDKGIDHSEDIHQQLEGVARAVTVEMIPLELQTDDVNDVSDVIERFGPEKVIEMWNRAKQLLQ